jgi:arylsulfatase A-like enzyme
MDRRKFIKLSMLSAAGFAGAGRSSSLSADSPRKRPNILHILIDDLGFADVGYNGGGFCETPNIDRLATQGMRFTNGYAPAPICSPSRAAFLTGKTPARLNFEFVTKFEGSNYDWNQAWRQQWDGFEMVPPPFTLNLPIEEITIADALKTAGYATGIAGKWHVAAHHGSYNGWSQTHGPRKQGFDWGFETVGSHPYGWKKSEKGKFGDYKPGTFPEDDLTEESIGFMEDNVKNTGKPFFLFVSHHYVHTPLGTKCKWLADKYRDKAKTLGRNYTDDQITYAAFVETMDHYVGQLLDALERLGIADDTLVFFTSDNGGHPSHAFNAPLRGSKWNLYEAGVRVPTIARRPGVIAANSVCDTPVMHTDCLPTYCRIAGAELTAAGDIDGRNIMPLMQGNRSEELENRCLYWHFPYYHPEGWDNYSKRPAEIGVNDGYISRTRPQSSIRSGAYKLIYFHDRDNCELYNLDKDIAERNDLSGEMPEKSQQLKQQLLDYLNKVNARLPRKY